MKINPWFVALVIAIAILVPLQKYIDQKADRQDIKFVRTLVISQGYQYRINVPDTGFYLPGDLDEISGLSMTDDPYLLAAIQDERGAIYLISTYTGEVEEEIKFDKGRDNEGIEIIGSTAYIVNSKGNITEVRNYYDSIEVTDYKTFLKSEDDVEGLCKDTSGHHLLLVCKSTQFKENKNRKIYRFDLDSMELDSIPFIELNNEAINRKMGKKPDGPKISPSAIAVHPITGEIFVLSSADGLFLVLDPSGEILQVGRLDRSVHRQPEGITFSSDGTMYISNEARDGVAKIYMFAPLSK